MRTIQRPRIVTIGGQEIRNFATGMQAPQGIDGKLTGTASVVETPYEMGGYTEVMALGAFDKTLAGGPDVQLLTNHEGLPYARTTIPPGQVGHLGLSTDYQGNLHVEAQLDPNDPDAVKIVNKIRSGLLDQMSFAFRVTKQKWSADNTLRTIQEVSLDRGDVSVVNFAASPTTSVDARSRRRGKGAPLSMYQARARALALRGRDLRIKNEAGRKR
jgi:HK97 family phage prohead protease